MADTNTKKILVIDDSTLERELLIEILKGSGIKNEFLQARSGEQAIEILGRNYKDVCIILLDWQMPEMSGLEFMEGVVKVPAVAKIPIVMVTASGSDDNKRQAKQVNPALAGYVVKPYEPEVLVDAIKPYLK
ncbi:MAG TPA: response regulator [Candidatus Omnitrophota bacterium]|nr:response regulator [Candidatus Omnitrophota bacterium]HQL41324.1 response regulator [Candidatus Omnitrophota bacterium]